MKNKLFKKHIINERKLWWFSDGREILKIYKNIINK